MHSVCCYECVEERKILGKCKKINGQYKGVRNNCLRVFAAVEFCGKSDEFYF